MQANARAHPTRPLQSGLTARVEVAYLRHGTQTLIANVEVATGHVLAPSVGPTRPEAEFMRHRERTMALEPAAGWMCMVDHLHTHQSEALVRWVAKPWGIDADGGGKGNAGLFASLPTRVAFVQEPLHRSRWVCTPQHTAGLKQAEIWFSLLVTRRRKRARFVSGDELRERLIAFID
jgi:hypothetical protein